MCTANCNMLDASNVEIYYWKYTRTWMQLVPREPTEKRETVFIEQRKIYFGLTTQGFYIISNNLNQGDYTMWLYVFISLQ